ncbi:methyl-accepting chemotaxis protein [Gracilibacillus marinus]|uniref:Methyl-accepting chemotaxis protein n=1 Tax=Gracilibacillus marinus TaxID=630535 RepID=A0ABV8VVS8_9BACI
MKKLFNFKSIKTKIMFGFGIVIALVFTMSVLVYLSFERINNDTKEMVEEQLPLLILDKDLSYNMAQSSSLIRGYFLYNDEDIKKQFEETIQKGKQIEEELLALGNQEKMNALFTTKHEWESTLTDAITEYESGNQEEALNILLEAKQLTQNIADEIEALANEKTSDVMGIANKSVYIGKAIIIFISIISSIILIIGVIIALVTSTSITKPVLAVRNRMNQLADGDMSQPPLETKARDEVAELVMSTNKMSQNNRNLLNRIAEVSETVSSQSEELTQAASEVKAGTEQVATTMEELATGAETQASSASDLSTIMGTFSDKVEQANENGVRIQENSGRVLEMTTVGSQLMHSSTEQMAKIDTIVKDAVDKMQNLDKQSQEISKLVSVIKDVAEQTNLLALNAAIESARAGEHGKGFAVVADEVRKLAEQVALSVNDITGIVSNIQVESSVVADSLKGGYNEVIQGTDQIKTTSETFNDISSAVSEMVSSVKYVSESLSGIASSSREMNEKIEEVASVSEEAAAGVEQTAASAEQASGSMDEVADSSEQLAKLAEELNDLVSKYKV